MLPRVKGSQASCNISTLSPSSCSCSQPSLSQRSRNGRSLQRQRCPGLASKIYWWLLVGTVWRACWQAPQRQQAHLPETCTIATPSSCGGRGCQDLPCQRKRQGQRWQRLRQGVFYGERSCAWQWRQSGQSAKRQQATAPCQRAWQTSHDGRWDWHWQTCADHLCVATLTALPPFHAAIAASKSGTR